MLGVLDGVVLVVSAVEGVQAQTLVLMRALQRLRIPTLFFVNKTDRAGADVERVVGELRARLGANPVPLWALDAEQLAEHDDELLAAYHRRPGARPRARDGLADLTRRAVVQPVLHGSALTGRGRRRPSHGDRRASCRRAPANARRRSTPTVFKIDRGAKGEKVAYVRLFAGGSEVRDRVGDAKVTQLEVFDHGGAVAPAGRAPARSRRSGDCTTFGSATGSAVRTRSSGNSSRRRRSRRSSSRSIPTRGTASGSRSSSSPSRTR